MYPARGDYQLPIRTSLDSGMYLIYSCYHGSHVLRGAVGLENMVTMVTV